MASDVQLEKAHLLAREADLAGDIDVVLSEAEAKTAAARTAASRYAADLSEDQVIIFDPEHESLSYGPASDIEFGPRGGFEPHVWIGPRDHPLVDKMMLEHPKMFELGAEKKVIACGDCMAAGVTPNEFKTLQAFRGHRLARHGGAVKDAGIDQG